MLVKKNQEAANTREQKKKQKAEEKAAGKRIIRIRLVPIWLRVIIVLILIAGSLILGAFVGYSVMGGGKASDIFEKSTWMHIKDLVEKE
ncbi:MULTISPECIES: DNA-directed RNA polymerase subunit beta [Bacillus]|uniref:Hydroxymyristoyl-ACP dehydratase n=2 Tax=Bacillus infantis TaxID=324767 RepID=U5LGE5_9BACI|nr:MULTISPECIES: DNA-directed RNA polymerase subunit beta [Bacillus]AGX06545.1 hydroxymyristoyl-ACP dehydratase [Bacillus infantis NRRL B-14911]EAR68520.1 (3R)-hydroxymyristoyl ACP dehydratase [Bacillus sp. NRRL B-14911]MCA1033435.1 DNA-directed RNA polymerase subunit beta [Bacillus infantis]MCP1160752.1 DNA-directed RNA polymerase subunit beta [Bacillus infantis]MDT0161550.1 DNA-directed RNA polymerase subunit beta [Bacillus sp. AG4(2022)]